MIILSAKNLYKSYDTVNVPKIMVLNGVDLEVRKGEILTIKGASGSGKSTLLNALGLLHTIDDGKIIINGQVIEDITSFENIRAESIGFLFQFHHLLSEFTVEENLLIPQLLTGSNSKESLDWALELLKSVSLLEIAKKFPVELSGGERQRVAFLRAIINKPHLVLADEPTGNLDDQNTDIMLNLILSIRDRFNIAFIIATHDNKVSNISDRHLILEDGKLQLSLKDKL